MSSTPPSDTSRYEKLPANFFIEPYPHMWREKLYVTVGNGNDPSLGFREFTGPGGHLAGEYSYNIFRLLPEACTPHGLDTPQQVFFYEQEFYPFSNFSSFRLHWAGIDFDTSEAAYHYEKFSDPTIRQEIIQARSAHAAFKIAEANKAHVRADWPQVRVGIMREILREKVNQHPYVRKKLLDSGDRELIENSWRDSFWGWGPDRNGQNILGKLWMEIRASLRAQPSTT